LFPAICIAFNGDKETVFGNAEYELRLNNIYLYLKSIQHEETTKMFYLQNFIPDSNLEHWTEFFETEMQKVAKARGAAIAAAAVGLCVGLRSHPINNGKKYTGSTAFLANQKRGTHIEMVNSSADLCTDLLSEVLKSKAFTSCYGAKVWLTPVVNCNQSSSTKERIRRCQAQHKQILDSIKTEYRGGIELFDSISEKLGKTLRQLILMETLSKGKRLFISVDRNMFFSDVNFSFPKKYKVEAHDRMMSIGAYLHKRWGDPILQFFAMSEQTSIWATKWNDEGKPILPIDAMLDTLEDETKEDWMMDPIPEPSPENLSCPNSSRKDKEPLVTDKEATANVNTDSSKPPGSFSPHFVLPDTDSIGTWGSKLNAVAGNNDWNSLTDSLTTTTSNTTSSTETYISQIENLIKTHHKEMADMKDMFSALMMKLDSNTPPSGVLQEGTGREVATPATSGAPPGLSGGAVA